MLHNASYPQTTEIHWLPILPHDNTLNAEKILTVQSFKPTYTYVAIQVCLTAD